MYENGRGVPENDAEAVRWYLLVAEQGEAGAQLNLGNMYANGEGLPQNDVRAYAWFSVSAALGDETSRNNRDIVAERLTPAQLAQGQ
jgi:TPR repeat protein